MKQAIIHTAPNVSDDAYAYICARLAERFGADSFARETDDTLLGGFVVLLDGKVYDMSLRTQLQALRADCEKE